MQLVQLIENKNPGEFERLKVTLQSSSQQLPIHVAAVGSSHSLNQRRQLLLNYKQRKSVPKLL